VQPKGAWFRWAQNALLESIFWSIPMKALTTLLTTSLFAANAYAVDIYQGFADGNSELHAWQRPAAADMTGVQPGIGDSQSRYGAQTNLFRGSVAETKAPASWSIYNGLESPDLSPNH